MDKIAEDFEVFVTDGDVAVGAVRAINPGGKPLLVIYVENAGDFTVSLDAVRDVHDGKVVLDCGKLDPGLQAAIGHAHAAEDARVADQPGGSSL